jgi:hypothetical protein
VTSAATAPDATNVGGFGYGIDPQDRTQPDAGTNDVQNAPVLAEAAVGGGQMSVTGTLHGRPGMAYTIEVFADDNQNPFGAGEGQRAVGRVPVTTDGAGNAALSATFPAPPSSARFVSATATTVPGGGTPGVTSEFAINVPVTTGAPAPEQGGTPPGTTPPPGKPGTPAGDAATGVKTSGSTVTTDGKGSITLPAVVTCASVTASACTVTSTATIVPASGGKAHTSAAKGKKKPKPVTIGSGTLKLKPGAHGKPVIKLNASGLKALKRAHTLTATVTVKVSGSGRKAVTKAFKLKLTYKKPSKASKKKGK